jgi:hypothetical protein
MQRGFKWLFGCDTGMSSKAILGHMICGVSDGSWPSDGGDLGRCLRLLDLFPEWKGRIGEMARYGKVWSLYVEHWDQIVSADDPYDLMKSLQKQAGWR